MRRSLILLLALLLISEPGGADEREEGIGDALDGLSGKAAFALVQELAADAMKGRKTAFEGGSLVEKWMLEKFSTCKYVVLLVLPHISSIGRYQGAFYIKQTLFVPARIEQVNVSFLTEAFNNISYIPVLI